MAFNMAYLKVPPVIIRTRPTGAEGGTQSERQVEGGTQTERRQEPPSPPAQSERRRRRERGTQSERRQEGGAQSERLHEEGTGSERRKERVLVTSPRAPALPAELLRLHLSLRLSELLVKNSFECDVKPYKDVPEKRVMPFRVKRVVSPYEFYMEYAIENMVQSYGEWYPAMQTHYNDPENATRRSLKGGSVVKGKCYVFHDVRTNFWHRVRVHDFDPDGKFALAFFCDLGKRRKVKLEHLREMDPSFCTWSAQVFRGYLYDVIPIDGSYTWSRAACHFFKELVKNKVFSGIVMCRSDELVTHGFPDVVAQMGIVMFENQKEVKDGAPGEKLCTLNALMVDKGFAFPIGIFGNCNHTFLKDRPAPRFDLKEYRKDFPVAADAVVPSFPRPSGSTRVQTRRRTLLGSTDTCEDYTPPDMSLWTPLWRANGQTSTLGLREPVTYQNSTEKLPTKINERLAFIKLIFVMGPNHLVVQLKSKEEELHAMQSVIRQAVEDEPPLTMEQLVPGTFVCCHIYDDENNDIRIWSRAVVKTINPKTNSAKVILVDYGNEVFCRLDYIRLLPEPFWNIPSFALRVHLDVNGLVPHGQSGWTDDACLMFRRYSFAWEIPDPLYYMHRPRYGKDLFLTDYTQDIQFDFTTNEWVLGPEKNIDSHQVINGMREHPMLQSIYRSTGVELYYEVIVPGSAFWFFEPLYDDTIKMGFATWDKKPVEKDEIHGIITDSDSRYSRASHHSHPSTSSHSSARRAHATSNSGAPPTTSIAITKTPRKMLRIFGGQVEESPPGGV